jgi:hypothetical protein
VNKLVAPGEELAAAVALAKAITVDVGLGRTVALYNRPSTLYHIC